MPQKQKMIDLYKKEKVTKGFDYHRSKHEYQRYKHKIESDFFKKAISEVPSRNIKILDVACGTGRMLPEIFKTKKKIKYVGLDSSKEMFNELKKKEAFKKNKKDISLVLADATKMPFKDNSFDIVCTYHLLWHLPENDQETVINEMLRVTKKGGIIILDILNKDFLWEKTKKYFGKKKAVGLYKQTPSAVKKVLGKVENIEIEKLSDAIIENSNLYRLFNIVNIARRVLPSSFFHMIYFKIKK
jgi:ubiquinone/menaquinone biosynthesis C-methylase UbiE